MFFSLSPFLLRYFFFLTVNLYVWMHSQQTSPKSSQETVFIYYHRRDDPFSRTFFSSAVMNRCYFIFRPTGTAALRGMNGTIHLSIVLIRGWSIHSLELKLKKTSPINHTCSSIVYMNMLETYPHTNLIWVNHCQNVEKTTPLYQLQHFPCKSDLNRKKATECKSTALSHQESLGSFNLNPSCYFGSSVGAHKLSNAQR